ncbi:MAG TPA: ABC transporter permease [Polyangiaceae bacterium]|nr:ABC transporter permease [Polyangiaceae bacterium]
MSVQTGAISPSGPASKRLVDRAKYRVDRWRTEPNPLWIRELRQAARLQRTPIILMVVAIAATLLIAAIGGIVSTTSNPATTGVVIFQVFFSLAYFVVTVVGPAVAANSIASEREGRTWEAVILTGLSPGEIARGKFLAAYTAICMYIVMLAPVGALPFLFGGVTATEVLVAFFFLFLIALLSVAFGLAISSKMASLRVAIVVTLLLAFPITIAAYFSFGVGLSYLAHEAWPGVADGPPVWLPTAYARAPFDLTYVVFLILTPIAAVTLPAWFLYEATIANLTSVTDDRSTGLKRWFLVAAPALTATACAPVAASPIVDREGFALAALSFVFVFMSFAAFLFAGDPIGPSRRVKAQWTQERAGRIRRFLGPSAANAGVLVLFAGVVSLLALAAFSVLSIQAGGHTRASEQIAQVAAFTGYAVGFHIFTAGLAAWLRSRTSTPLTTRVLLFTVLFVVVVGPWIIAAITGLLSRPGAGNDALFIASPSPLYAFVMVDDLSKTISNGGPIVAGGLCAAAWTVIGLGFLAAAKRRCDKVIRQHEAALAQTDQLLAQEDEEATAAAEAAEKSAIEAAQSQTSEPQGTWTGRGPEEAPQEPQTQGEPAASPVGAPEAPPEKPPGDPIA